MWHVSSRSGVATLRTAIHLLLTYLLTIRLSLLLCSGFCERFLSEKLEARETYIFRLRFVQPDNSTSDWSPELSVTTSGKLHVQQSRQLFVHL